MDAHPQVGMRGAGQSPTAAVVIIGNEILSGRTTDANLPYIAQKLGDHGVTLVEVRFVPDIVPRIAKVVKEYHEAYDYVFTTGGIGPTHDDITAEAIAHAFGCELLFNPEAQGMLEAHYGKENVTPSRLKMALFPKGATPVANPSSGAPGFCMKNVYVLAGVPSIMRAMFDGILPRIQHGPSFHSETVSCLIGESRLAQQLEDIQKQFPHVSIGSYPFFHKGKIGTSLVARHQDPYVLKEVRGKLEQLVYTLNGTPIVKEEL
ncbi:MAG: competence/damage-inducible protein A [Alphaproteobacteria bacterium]